MEKKKDVMNGTMNTKVYIVDECAFKIKSDEVDFENPILKENGSNKLSGMYSYYFRGKKTNLWPEGRLYLAENCFKTKKEAIAKLKKIVLETIEENLILIENLENENKKLYKIMEDLKHE